MTTLLPFLLLLIIQCAIGSCGVEACPSTCCGGIKIKFPFGIRRANQSDWCNLISMFLDSSSDLVIKGIDYATQSLWVNDPNQCLPRRFLQDRLNLSSSPFQFDLLFFTISSTSLSYFALITSPKIKSSLQFIVSAISPIIYLLLLPTFVSNLISNIDPWLFFVNMGDDLQLTWGRPRCGRCKAGGQDYGFEIEIGVGPVRREDDQESGSS